jgi:cytochrome c oxidase subunit 2
MQSEDVIHSFFLPDLRLKQDVVPGKNIPVWFEVTRAGEYPIGCAELCGNGHTRMRGTLTVLEEAEYRAWVQSQSADREDD